ncbi:uncharacterized protein LOC113235254 [Hyposmocoma kahamanoa]|uniref:uncharacterized protein LOC113235254 n=1 Tax=Hyposmocoma kahamanoa TaxID=1477025 RepID=UPI000E6D878A|nr:uncharacterized protein LOC113235254 [Hyposmocoma kahamanoa]
MEGHVGDCKDSCSYSKLNDVAAEKMRDALTAIVQEIKRYQSRCPENDEHVSELETCIIKLKTKRKQVKILKENLKSTCMVAKTVINAKKKEIKTLNDNLMAAKNNSEALIKTNNEISEAVNNLTAWNHTLNEKYLHLVNFVNLGYKELQKMRDENLVDMPAVMQLKEIMVGCGQYYADFCNERQKNTQLEQKNRFLTNKLRILENNLLNVSEELNKVQFKEKKQKSRANQLKEKTQNIGVSGLENNFEKQALVPRISFHKPGGDMEQMVSNRLSVTGSASLNLSSHLSLVKNLLNDQDTMLRDLKKLSDELSING